MMLMRITPLCIILQIPVILGCSCFWGVHKQTQFCQAGYAIKAEVKSEEVETSFNGYPLHKYYTLNVLKVYKEHENISIGHEAVVRTGADGGMCGAWLKRNITYFISGSVWENVMQMSSCGWISYFDRLTKSQLHGIEHDYGENCDCAQQIVPGMMFGSSAPCGYGTDKPFEFNCYFSSAVCKRHGPFKCAWEIDRKANPCKKRNPQLLRILKVDE